MKELDYEKEFTSGNTTITRCDYEDMPVPMNTSSLSDDEMQRLAEAIEQEMERWKEWLDNGDVNQDQYDEAWWESMEHLGLADISAPAPRLYIASLGEEAMGKAIAIVERLRRSGVYAECDTVGRSLKAQMKYANKLGADYTLIIGNRAVRRSCVI